MIAHLKGTITAKSHQLLIVDVHGVGYAVSVHDDRIYKKEQEIALHIHMHWNQDNGPTLYGFDSVLAKTVFGLIVSCSGCGPKIGLAVFVSMPPGFFLQVIATADAAALSQVSGIGPKKAELMIMQLKDKVAKVSLDDIHPAKRVGLQNIKQVSQALSALHYKPSEIAVALDFLNKNVSLEKSSFDDLLRQALSALAKTL